MFLFVQKKLFMARYTAFYCTLPRSLLHTTQLFSAQYRALYCTLQNYILHTTELCAAQYTLMYCTIHSCHTYIWYGLHGGCREISICILSSIDAMCAVPVLHRAAVMLLSGLPIHCTALKYISTCSCISWWIGFWLVASQVSILQSFYCTRTVKLFYIIIQMI